MPRFASRGSAASPRRAPNISDTSPATGTLAGTRRPVDQLPIIRVDHSRRAKPRINANTSDPARPSAVDPARGQALALRRWTNWALFCFLNTHRCSGSTLSIFFFSCVFHHP